MLMLLLLSFTLRFLIIYFSFFTPAFFAFDFRRPFCFRLFPAAALFRYFDIFFCCFDAASHFLSFHAMRRYFAA